MCNKQLQVSQRQVTSLLNHMKKNSELKYMYDHIKKAESVLNFDLTVHNIIEIHDKYKMHLDLYNPSTFNDGQFYKKCFAIEKAFSNVLDFHKMYSGTIIYFAGF